MRITLLVHIAAGGVGIVSGYLAVFAAKGGRLHRRAGIVFVWSMSVMAAMGAGMAAARAQVSNVVAGVLAAYLVVTALTAVRPQSAASRRVETGGMLLALATGVAALAIGVRSLAAQGMSPNFIFVVFGAVALLSALGDARMLRVGGLRGPRRLARHLWRMCFALFVAAGSFFLGQADEFSERLRVWPVLATLSFLPLLLMAYWLWRVRRRQAFRGGVRVHAPEAAPRRARMPVGAA
ncbi:MAG TPA: hypothetical protein VGX50_10285 [Longimicrobium sp.]|jgi:hypothetical protein|nr:hypothetical protein [Longimicrobium sp.]